MIRFGRWATLVVVCVVPAARPQPPAGAALRLETFAKRASEIDPRAREHPEIDFRFVDAKGKPADVQNAAVDRRVPARGKLVVWLSGHNPALFERVAGYGYHAIQVHYANRWPSAVDKAALADGTNWGKARLEAATGEDASPLISVPKPDAMTERAFRFVTWLAKEHPAGGWGRFVAADGTGLRWEDVVVAGSSHGSSTAARFAVHRTVDRVVMFCGPRDQTETWQASPSATPAERFFGFSHVLDGGWTGDHYCRSWELLGLHKFGPVVTAEGAAPPYGNTRRLVTACDVNNDAGRAHGVVVPGGRAARDAAGKYLHEDVWRYLFTHPTSATGDPVPPDPACRRDHTAKPGAK